MNELYMTYEQLGAQAAKAAADRLAAAIESVDRLLGEGAARQNPALVAALLQSTSTEYLALMFSHRIYPILEDVAGGLRDISDTLGEPGNG